MIKRETWLQGIGWGLVAIVLISGFVGGLVRGMYGMPNWGSLSRESQYLWAHGTFSPGTAMFGYLPGAVFALWPWMVWLPKGGGVVLYNLLNLGAAVGSIWIVYRWWLREEERRVYVWPVLLAAGTFQIVMVANQLTLWALFLGLAGMTLAAYRREWSGGLLIGLGGVIKVMPFILVGYFLLRGRWRVATGAVLGIVIFDVIPSVLFFGWHGAVEEHMQWRTRLDYHSNGRQIADPLLIGVYKHGTNFSYSSVLTRWLEGMPEAKRQIILSGAVPPEVLKQYRSAIKRDEWLTVDPMPVGNKAWSVGEKNLDRLRRFSLGHLSSKAVFGVWVVTLVLGMGVLCWRTFRSGDWRAGCGAWIVSMFFVVPLMRDYYLALAFPAIVVVWNGLVRELRTNGYRWTPGALLALAGMVGWGIGVCSLGWETGRWYGIHLGVAGVLLAGTYWVWRKELPNPEK
jgi:hypothetical protein